MTLKIDMVKVEKLRQHMRLSQADIATVFGVSRVTYYNWTRGRPIRDSNAQRIKVCIRKLIAVVQAHGWPLADAASMTNEARVKRLVALMDVC